MDILLIKILVPLIFTISIIAIIYIFLKEPKQITKDFFSVILSTIMERIIGILMIPLIPFKILYLLIFHGGRLKKEDYQKDLLDKNDKKSIDSKD